MNNQLMHYGVKRKSGRFPWGSGDNPYQHDGGLRGAVKDLRAQGYSEKDIADGWGMSIKELRSRITISKGEEFAANAAQALRYKEKGYSNVEIGKLMNVSEGTVRNYLDPAKATRATVVNDIAKVLKENADGKRYIDVGTGVESHLGVSKEKLDAAIEYLKGEGYKIQYTAVEQLGTGHKTSLKVLTPPDVEYSEVYQNRHNVKLIGDNYFEDNGHTLRGIEPPQSVDSKRIAIRYAEDGGTHMDGVIQLRRGVEDISLGNSNYAQVRIAVDGTHYLKGMAMYSDDLPDGVDLLFNTNKHKDVAKMDVLKKMKDDEDNPFGATVRQRHYVGKDGKEHLSALNIVNEEGDWNDWARKLSSQMLSKQPTELAKHQLELTYNIKKDEFDEIMSLTNNAVKKKLLESFADDCDSSAVHLKAAGMPRQGSHVILPFDSIKDNEIYAPNYRNGEKVVLIRFPHGGTFEIPELTVNNKNKDARAALGNNPIDAVGINHKVAERLSGADFDGDTVLVIPNNEGRIKTSAPLKGLTNFDPKEMYPAYEGMKKVGPKTDGFRKQLEMGKVSNLITDMTIKGANADEIAAAVRHSMVVIDAEKHNLNWKQSAIDNGIAELKEKYQGGATRGASTLISKASSESRVGVRKELLNTSKMTQEELDDWNAGKKVYKYTNETYTDKKGKEVLRTTSSTKMYEAEDPFKLSSGTPIETIYANHASKLKALANEARKEYRNTGSQVYSPSAKTTYAKEVASLNEQLKLAEMNKPKERQAQAIAGGILAAKRKENPDMDNDEVKKLKGQLLSEARGRVGAKKEQIKVSQKEWDAIQAGAVSHNTLTKILNNTDLDLIKQYATPRESKGMSSSKIARAQSMADRGYTQAEIADMLGVSTSTLYEYAFK